MTNHKLVPVKRCAACGNAKPVSEMETCMHNQMHRYVCDSKCMNDFYNPPKNLRHDAAAPDVQGGPVEVECRQCVTCDHVGIDDHRDGHAACHECDWNGVEPELDQCPGCGKTDCMAVACPACGSRYELRDTKVVTATQPVEQHADEAATMKAKQAWLKFQSMLSPADPAAAPKPAEQHPDVTQMVEALERIAKLPIDPCKSQNDYRLSAAKAIALAAVSPYRKGGE